jgi:dATP pyrophosphohydrolase
VPGTPRYKRPESVLVLIYTRAGEVLLLQRRDQPDFWQSVTGSLEWGESAFAAAHRELKEETGLDAPQMVDCEVEQVFPILPGWRARYAPNVHHNREHLFRLELPSKLEIRLHPQEHLSFQWLPAQEAKERASSWTNREAIDRFVVVRR